MIPLLDKLERELLTDLYRNCSRTVDDLPYTNEFENLFHRFSANAKLNQPLDRHAFWRILSGERKASRLPRKKRI